MKIATFCGDFLNVIATFRSDFSPTKVINCPHFLIPKATNIPKKLCYSVKLKYLWSSNNKDMSYGRKIIDYIFAKRTKCHAICYELERKVQADSDRSDIRVFETGLPPQRYGDNRQSTRNAEATECNRLLTCLWTLILYRPYYKIKEIGIGSLGVFVSYTLYLILIYGFTLLAKGIAFDGNVSRPTSCQLARA